MAAAGTNLLTRKKEIPRSVLGALPIIIYYTVSFTIRLSQLHTSRISFPLLDQVELALPLAVQDDVFHVLCHYGAAGLPDS